MYLGSYIEDERLEKAVVGMNIGDIKNVKITFDQRKKSISHYKIKTKIQGRTWW